MKIREIMNQKVERADPTLPISKAAEQMRDLDIGFLPICEKRQTDRNRYRPRYHDQIGRSRARPAASSGERNYEARGLLLL